MKICINCRSKAILERRPFGRRKNTFIFYSSTTVYLSDRHVNYTILIQTHFKNYEKFGKKTLTTKTQCFAPCGKGPVIIIKTKRIKLTIRIPVFIIPPPPPPKKKNPKKRCFCILFLYANSKHIILLSSDSPFTCWIIVSSRPLTPPLKSFALNIHLQQQVGRFSYHTSYRELTVGIWLRITVTI